MTRRPYSLHHVFFSPRTPCLTRHVDGLLSEGRLYYIKGSFIHLPLSSFSLLLFFSLPFVVLLPLVLACHMGPCMFVDLSSFHGCSQFSYASDVYELEDRRS